MFCSDSQMHFSYPQLDQTPRATERMPMCWWIKPWPWVLAHQSCWTMLSLRLCLFHLLLSQRPLGFLTVETPTPASLHLHVGLSVILGLCLDFIHEISLLRSLPDLNTHSSRPERHYVYMCASEGMTSTGTSKMFQRGMATPKSSSRPGSCKACNVPCNFCHSTWAANSA